jgi:ElaB/YqjD/DUF883 family membrane-anchored ribosome-binding protein
MEQAHRAVENAEQTFRTATEKVARVAHDAVDSLRDYSDRAEDQLRDVSERSRQAIDKVTDYIEAHPWAALGIAAAVGFALGALAARSSSESEAQ